MIGGYDKRQGFGLERVFGAPPEMVFDAWTRPELLGWFFNPDNATTVPVSVDLRVGGQWRQHMVIDATNQYMTGGVYREIDRPRHLSFTFGATDGWPRIDLATLDDSPLVTLDFEAHPQGTLMRLNMLFPDSYSAAKVEEWTKSGAPEGWGMTVDRLVAVYPVTRSA
jgi:uncharacterized protein YndB with AHSA1/START domain